MTSAPAARARIPWLVIAGVLVAALSLRGPIVAPTPVLGDIEADLGIDPATAGLLTTAPVLMFAILTPVAALVIRRAGAEIALMLSLSGVLIGTLIRALPGFGWVLAGMIVIGASITIGNVVIPVIIRRDVPPERVAIVTASYGATLNVGSLVTSFGTAPLAEGVGWPLALLVWGGITLAGVIVWGVHLGRERTAGRSWGSRDSGEAPTAAGSASDHLDPTTMTGPMPVITAQSRSVLRMPVVWLLMGSFAAQTTAYYAFSTWLPTLAQDTLGVDQSEAGALASIFQGLGVAGAFLVPLIARFAPRIVPALVICGCWLTLTIGMLLVPSAFVVWVSFGAIAHAGGFVVIFTLLVGVARTDGEAAGMSALVQGGGYAVGALGAPVMGALHEASGDWTLPLAVMVGVTLAYTALLLIAFTMVRSVSRPGR